MMEVWKSIPNYGNYEASNQGRVRRVHSMVPTKNGRIITVSSRILKQKRAGRDGRLVVHLSNKGQVTPFYVARLVLLAFIGPPPISYQGSHLNGNKDDNRMRILSGKHLLQICVATSCMAPPIEANAAEQQNFHPPM